MLKEKDINLMPLVKRIPEFKRQATNSKNKIYKTDKRNGYDGSFVESQRIKAQKKICLRNPKPVGVITPLVL